MGGGRARSKGDWRWRWGRSSRCSAGVSRAGPGGEAAAGGLTAKMEIAAVCRLRGLVGLGRVRGGGSGRGDAVVVSRRGGRGGGGAAFASGRVDREPGFGCLGWISWMVFGDSAMAGFGGGVAGAAHRLAGRLRAIRPGDVYLHGIAMVEVYLFGIMGCLLVLEAARARRGAGPGGSGGGGLPGFADDRDRSAAWSGGGFREMRSRRAEVRFGKGDRANVERDSGASLGGRGFTLDFGALRGYLIRFMAGPGGGRSARGSSGFRFEEGVGP